MTDAELLAIIAQAEREGWTELDLSGKGLSELPAEIGKLSKLESLILGKGLEGYELVGDRYLQKVSGNNFKILPIELLNLPNLRKLDISGNPLEHIPDVVTQMLHLEELILTRVELTEIPDAISNLANLTQLDLSSNQIKEIPDVIVNLANLTTLDLSFNKITAIPKVITNLANLTTLDLTYNQITQIPDSIANLANLATLDLTYNQITLIPDAIAKLANLTTLSLYNNQITAIPDAIAKLANLTKFTLAFNRIQEIPDGISKLNNLKSLNLAYNQITQIPQVIENLPKLEELELLGNPLPISPEIHRTGSAKEIFNYLRQLRSGEVRPLNEAKLILVGQGSVGKSSLIKKLVRDRYDPNEPQTDGLNVEPWEIQVNSKDIRLNVWDFGGQEIYHATHQFFLTKRSLYLLVCNCRTSEEENRIEYWLKLIESFGDKSPVIIVGNKKDEQPFDINRKVLREKYPNIQAIIETSCSENIGIDELRSAILEQVANLEEIYDLIPLSWFSVKQQLEAMTEDFISYNRYIGICHENKIHEEQNQDQLIDLLHRLGLVLNFRDHPILKSTNVLKPEWVTEGIYALLSDETLKTINKGIFTLADLSRVLDPARYPVNRYYYLIELMKEFELCFDIDSTPKQFLIPTILPKDEPAKTKLEGDTLEFQYHYRVLPNSIISRFIVNTSDYIHNQTYWRSGVMLHYPESGEVYNIARIKADTEDKKIFIAIIGRKETRREFLAIIRKELNKIHKNFSNLDITEWVTIPEYPNIDPLNYQDLLIAEDAGESTVFVAKIRQRIDISKLLDGYEPMPSRQKSLNKMTTIYQNFSIKDILGDISSSEIKSLVEEDKEDI